MLVENLGENLEVRLCLLEVDMDWYLCLIQKGRWGIPSSDICEAVELVVEMTQEVSTVAVAVMVTVAVNAMATSVLDSHQEVVEDPSVEGKEVPE